MVFQLLTLAITMTFAACFLAVYLYEPSKKAPAVLSIAYACGSLSLAIGFFRYSMEPAHATIITNILYTTTMFLTTIGIAVHYKKQSTNIVDEYNCHNAGLLIALFHLLAAGYNHQDDCVESHCRKFNCLLNFCYSARQQNVD